MSSLCIYYIVKSLNIFKISQIYQKSNQELSLSNDPLAFFAQCGLSWDLFAAEMQLQWQRSVAEWEGDGDTWRGGGGRLGTDAAIKAKCVLAALAAFMHPKM